MLGEGITIALKATALNGAAHLVSRWVAKVPERPELVVYGEVIWLSEAFAAGSERLVAGGGGSATTTRRITRTKDHGSHSMMETGL